MAQLRNRITAAWNALVSGSPGLQTIAQTTVRPWEVSNQVGRFRKRQAQELVNGFTKYVAVAQSTNATGVAGVPIRVYRRVTTSRKSCWDTRPVSRKEILRQRSRSGAWTRKAADMSEQVDEVIDPLHPLVALLNSANALDNGFGLFEQTQLAIGLTGNAYWYCLPGPDGYPIEVWPLPPQFVHVIPSRDTVIGGYIFGRGYEIEQTFQPSEVVRFMQPNPRGDPFQGFGDLEKCILDAQLSVAFSEIRLAMIDNGAQPGIVVTAKGATDKQRQQLEDIVNQKFAGGQKWGRSMVLNGDCVITPWGMNEKESAFLQSDVAVRQTIANCHDIPDSLLTMENAALATAKASIPIWQERAIKPRLNRIVDVINQNLVPMFGDDRLYVSADECVERDAQVDSAIAVSMFTGDIITKNEARALVDFDHVPDGDQFASEYKQAQTLETLAATPDPVVNDPNQDPKASDAKKPKDAAPATEAKALRDVAGGNPPRVAASLASKALTCGKGCTCCGHKAKSMILPSEAELEAVLRSWFVGAVSDAYTSQIGENGLKKSVVSTMSRTLGQAIDAPLARIYLQGWNSGVQELGKNAGQVQQQTTIMTPAKITVSLIEPTTPSVPGISVSVTATPDPSILPTVPTMTPTGTLTTPVEKYLREYRGKTIQSVTETVDKRIREVLAEGISKGESIPQLTTRVQETVSDMSRISAERIARTESSRAFNAAKEKSWLESGMVWGKRWLLAPDACALCIQLAKAYGTQPLGKPFVTKGDTLTLDDGTTHTFDYADVEGGDAHPNDRCTMVMVMEEPQ